MSTLVQTRRYDREDSVVFRKTNEEYGGLSNMASGFPLRVNGIDIRTSEALYQACRFPHVPDVQRMIIAQRSPMTAKMKSKPYRDQSRQDWNDVRVSIMRWCLRVKLASNWTKFRNLLLATGESPIVEDSWKDAFWGAKTNGEGILVGANVLGRLLMELREALREASCDALRRVEPPAISDFQLNGEPIRTVEAADVGAEDLVTTMVASASGMRTGDHAGATSAYEMKEGSSSISTGLHERSRLRDESKVKRHARRLIEVDLPIRDLSRFRGRRVQPRFVDTHQPALWWSRKPQNQARGIWLALLAPDPGDEALSPTVKARLKTLLCDHGLATEASNEEELRSALRTACLLTADPASLSSGKGAALLGGIAALYEQPVIGIDPFAGSGSIPLEGARATLQMVASDYNPLAVAILRAALELGIRVTEEDRAALIEQLKTVVRRALSQVFQYHPPHPELGPPLGYVCFRQLRCEGPGCGRTIPATSKFVLLQKPLTAIVVTGHGLPGETVSLSIRQEVPDDHPLSTMKQGALSCPVCDFVTKRARVAAQSQRERLKPIPICAVYKNGGSIVLEALTDDQREAEQLAAEKSASWTPNDAWPSTEPRRFSPPIYGYRQFIDCHTDRQAHFLGSLIVGLRSLGHRSIAAESALGVLATLLISRAVEGHTSFCRWRNDRGGSFERTFAGKSIGMIWDFFELNPLHSNESLELAVDALADVLVAGETIQGSSTVIHAAAQELPLPDDSVDLLYTDPPYYDSIPYAHLSDWMLVWAKGAVADLSLEGGLAPKSKEVVVDRPHSKSPSTHNASYYHIEMRKAFERCRAVLKPNGVGVVVFAHKSTSAWEHLLEALVEAGFVLTASWPIKTERGGRLQAQGTASLHSSVHLVVRPREEPCIAAGQDLVGDWRAILRALPVRLHEWMPRLAREGVVGADAIFACLGPALEIFSRYSSVEKVSGQRVELREYLEHVWAAVAREALSMIFEDADATGFEEDARLTAMWLWTLSTGFIGGAGSPGASSATNPRLATAGAGLALEFDAARKIAQGLGAHLEDLGRVVEIKGDRARLLSVTERTRYLFAKQQVEYTPPRRASKVRQLTLFEELQEAETDDGWDDVGLPPPGETTLDRVHQAMVLFAAGRSEALKRFLVEEGIGADTRVWKLAQSLSALYPAGTEEKRWVDGVLARKTGLGY